MRAGRCWGGGVSGKAGQEGLGFEQGTDLEEEDSNLSSVAECQMARRYLAFGFQQCQYFILVHAFRKRELL